MRKFLLLSCTFVVIFGLWQIKLVAFAEESGLSPESGSNSRIKTAYDWLVGKGDNYGSTDALDWDSATYSWGTYLNRIMESASWEPDGTAVEADVTSGKTFYAGSDNRTQKTGSLSLVDYSKQSLAGFVDSTNGDGTTEESSWTNTATNVWMDSRTGLYWSNNLGTYINNFSRDPYSPCDFFQTNPRGSYDGSDSTCGDAINACAELSLEAVTAEGAETDWYLPTQKELFQAYIDGIYNQTSSSFATANIFWGSTELSSEAVYYGTNTNAWSVNLSNGTSNYYAKNTSNYMRCVRRN